MDPTGRPTDQQNIRSYKRTWRFLGGRLGKDMNVRITVWNLSSLDLTSMLDVEFLVCLLFLCCSRYWDHSMGWDEIMGWDVTIYQVHRLLHQQQVVKKSKRATLSPDSTRSWQISHASIPFLFPRSLAIKTHTQILRWLHGIIGTWSVVSPNHPGRYRCRHVIGR